MKVAPFTRLSMLAILAIVATGSFAYSQWLNNNEIEFTGPVSSFVDNGEGGGTLFVLLDTFEQRVIINPKTILRKYDGSPLAMNQIAQGDIVEVTGKFSSSGVLATIVRVLEEAPESDGFRLRGSIKGIQPSADGTVVSLLGITILVTDATTIEMDGAVMTPADLHIGARILATGQILSADSWLAKSITILTENKRRGSLAFEGTVVSFDSATGVLVVAVNGVSENQTTVRITQSTRIEGVIDPGDFVLVMGVLNSDLSVKAKEVRVLGALELKPDVCKMEVGEPATFAVKLREPAAENVTVTLQVDPSDALQLPPDALVIPAGEQMATFDVIALKAGKAVLSATALGDTATAVVKVSDPSEDGTGPPEAEVKVAFSPDHIKVEPNESREVVLHINPPQKMLVEVTFEIASDVPDLFTVEGSRLLSNGAANQKVMIQAGAATGEGTLTVTLPDTLGGGQAVLKVEVRGKENGK